MITVTVLFRRVDSTTLVNIGAIDPATNVATWYEASPITGLHTFNEWEEIVRPSVVRFANTLDLGGLHGGRLAYVGEIHSMMEFDFDSPTDESDDETLGPCGCTDYHMSDCPTRTDSHTFREYEPYPEDDDHDGYTD